MLFDAVLIYFQLVIKKPQAEECINFVNYWLVEFKKTWEGLKLIFICKLIIIQNYMFIQYFSSISILFYGELIKIPVITKKDHMCSACIFFLPLNYNWYRWCCTPWEKREAKEGAEFGLPRSLFLLRGRLGDSFWWFPVRLFLYW